MKRTILASFLLATLMLWNAASAAPVNNVWIGRVQHVSTTNLKVYGWQQHQVQSFMLVPRFKQIFSQNGKTTYQMAKLKPGMFVKVYYDQKALGMRHADRIIVLGANDVGVAYLKS